LGSEFWEDLGILSCNLARKASIREERKRFWREYGEAAAGFGAQDMGRARASRKSRVPHEIEEEGRWGPKRRRFRPRPAGNERCGEFQPGEEFFVDALSLSYSLSARSSVCMTCTIFSQLTHPYNTCSERYPYP
jgi:hypothetical protein